MTSDFRIGRLRVVQKSPQISDVIGKLDLNVSPVLAKNSWKIVKKIEKRLEC